jgi:hypothetical protein
VTAPAAPGPRDWALASLEQAAARAGEPYRSEAIAIAQVHAHLAIGDQLANIAAALNRLADTQHPNPWETP